MSSRKTKKVKQLKKKKDKESKESENLDEQDIDQIAAAAYAGTEAEEMDHVAYMFGIKRSKRRSRNKIHHRARTKRSKRRSKNRSRSFGAFEGTTENLKRFLVIVAFILIRSAAKGNLKNTIYQDVANAEIQTLNFLTITSLLEILGVLVGKENRDKILFAYMLYSIGSDISRLV